jgi:hypothetical protein
LADVIGMELGGLHPSPAHGHLVTFAPTFNASKARLEVRIVAGVLQCYLLEDMILVAIAICRAIDPAGCRSAHAAHPAGVASFPA